MTRLFAGTPFDIPPQCDHCGKPELECACTTEEKSKREAEQKRQAALIAPDKQTARVTVQKRKGGRKVTVVEGLTASANDLADLLSKLQAACGTGGTVKAKVDQVELQGDHIQTVSTSLRQLGYKVK
ncbi:MAG: translation initiation factor [Planctomycetota bacterium]